MRKRPKREDMRGSRDHSYEHRGSSGKFGKIYKGEYLQDMKFWVPGKGEHEFMVIPYYVGSETNSDFRRPDGLNKAFTQEQIDENRTFDYKLTVLVHSNIGVNKDTVLCPRTVGRKCPICEHRDVLDNEGASDEELRPYGTAKKALYNVMIFDSEKEFNKGVQVWEAPHQSIEDELTDLAVEKDRRTGEVIEKAYNYPEDGWNVVFEKLGSGLSTEYKGVKILERTKEQELTGKEMDQAYDDAIDFEDAIEEKSYEELYEMLHGVAPDEDRGSSSGSDENRGSRFRGRSSRKEEKEERKGRSRGRSRSSKKEDDEPKGRGRGRSRSNDSKESDKPECFGKKTNEIDDCQDCPDDLYDACYEEYHSSRRNRD